MLAGIPRTRLRRAALSAAVGALVLFASSCVPPSALPDGSVPQAPPIGANGVAVSGDTVWLADLFGGQLLQIDLADGDILRRIGPDQGIAPPDDLVVAPDGSLIYTSPGTGIVGRVRLDGPAAGRVGVLAKMSPGVNPIALVPDGSAVVVGYGSGDTDRVDRIDLATGAVSVVAVGVPGLNGFSFGPDGGLWAPIGGALAAITGEGGVVRIDMDHGTVGRLPLSFPDEPGKRGLQLAAALKWTPDGRLLAVQGVGGQVYEVDEVTGESHRFATLGGGYGDNEVGLTDGRVVVTGFFGTLYLVGSDGVATLLPIGG